jgi:hypothetical protein
MDFLTAVQYLQNNDCEGILIPIRVGGNDPTNLRHYVLAIKERSLTYMGILYPNGTLIPSTTELNSKGEASPNITISGLRISPSSILSQEWSLHKPKPEVLTKLSGSPGVERRIKVKKDVTESKHKSE